MRLLGPVEVESDDGRLVVLGAAKERSLVAVLALAGGAAASTDSLIWALWGDEPPAAARKTLQTYVWNLRKALGANTVITEPAGYRLRIGPGDVDIDRFRTLVREGDDALRRGDTEPARRLLAEALGLWRDEPFTGVAQHTGLAAQAVRLQQERLSALEARIAADLAAARHHDVVGELEMLVQQHPFRERLWGHLMLALYRCGRQADALAVYQRVRVLLREELGLEPGGDLRRLETAILRQEIPALGDRSGRTAPVDVVRPSPIGYACTSDNVNIAYQVAGRGPLSILSIPGYIHHLDIWWNAPTDRLVRMLTALGRLVVFDKRGLGLSDRPEEVAIDGWTQDALAVLDASKIRRAVVLGVSDGALSAIQLAAMHPERVQALVIFGGYARQLADPEYPIGHDPAIVDAYVRHLEQGWGTGVALSSAAPSRSGDPDVRAYWARYQALSASPAAAMRYLRASVEADVRDLLDHVSVPTLVTHAERDVLVPVAHGRYLADRIAGAEFVALDSDIHLLCVSDVLDQLAEHIASFLGRVVPRAARPRAEAAPMTPRPSAAVASQP